MRKTIITFLTIASVACTSLNAQAAINYLPGVKQEMSSSSFWSSRQNDRSKILLDSKQISRLNKKIMKTPATNMFDLKNQPASLNGIELSNQLYESAKNEVSAFIDEKYDEYGNITGADYYEDMVNNCKNPDAVENQFIRYAITVNRTNLLAFPTEKAILDDPGDNDFDNLFLSSVTVNEPVVVRSVSADGKYYQVYTDFCPGWISAEDIAICENRKEWLDAWDFPENRLLVVYGSRISTEDSRTNPDVARRRLSMGTRLELVTGQKRGSMITNRSTYNNYIVYLPVRNENGSYEKKAALISQHKKVKEGYLDLTKENIAKVAFGMLGDTYGWGGMLGSEDCSGYVRNVYRCFGFELARNTTWQSAMPVKKYDMTDYTTKKKEAILDDLSLGSILFFPGHEMLYLGKVDGRYYVIDSVSSIIKPGSDQVQRVRSVIINPLDLKRRNGELWIESMNAAIVLWNE